MPSLSGAELAHSQSERAGTDTFQISVNSANVQTYEAPAVAAVLQTNELLHLIISEVPRELRTSLRRVSKAWQAAVEKIGHAFEPEGYAVCEGQGPCLCPSSPLYASHIAFRIHTALYATGPGYGDPSIKTCVGASQTNYYRIIWLGFVRAAFEGGSDIARFAGNEHEFITSPPVTEVTTSEFRRCSTILRASGGVQFRYLVEHLLEVTQVGSMHPACVRFATQLPNVEPKSELRDSSSEEEDEDESEEHSESDEVEDSDREDSEDGAGSSSDSENGSEEGDSTSGEKDRVEGSNAAMDAVMQTSELFHLIIGEVPVEHRTSIRRVAKAWQAAVVKIGHALQPVAYNEQYQPLYSVSKTFVVNMSNPVIHCYRNSRDEINGFQFNPDHLSGNPKIAGRLCEFLTDPPVTHVSLSCYTKRRKTQAILRVHGGIRIRDLVEIFGKMKPKGLQKGEYAYIATQDLDDEGNVIVKPVEPPAEDDSSDSGDESVSDDSDRWYRPESDDSDDPDEPDSGKPGDSDGDNLSEHDDAGGSSDSDYCSEVGDSRPDEDEQVEESSAAAVLDTNELLHMILSEVPREHESLSAASRRIGRPQWRRSNMCSSLPTIANDIVKTILGLSTCRKPSSSPTRCFMTVCPRWVDPRIKRARAIASSVVIWNLLVQFPIGYLLQSSKRTGTNSSPTRLSQSCKFALEVILFPKSDSKWMEEFGSRTCWNSSKPHIEEEDPTSFMHASEVPRISL
jgi:hypothetical protein